MAKEEFETLDEAFQPDEEELNQEQEEKKAQEETVVESEETEETKEEPESKEPEKEPETEESEKEPEFKWSDYGQSRYDNMTPQQIANEVAWRNRKYGEQANELGKLRKEVEELRTKKEEKPEPPLKMSEGQLIDFSRQWEEDPVNALANNPVLEKLIEKKAAEIVEKQVSGKVSAVTQEQADALAFQNFCSRNPDYEIYVDSMKELDRPEYLGDQKRSYDDLLELTKLGHEDDSLYQAAYVMMKKYPNMSCSEAQELAKLKSPPKKKIEREQLKKEVKDIDAVSTKSKRASSKQKEVLSMDDAFDMDD